ncbi:hypothetical protein FRC07_000236 [Ceratobasidium sp. 392]|nr:hypothetical protein FRC07_000236 [Ceratobasidium sp. 392]
MYKIPEFDLEAIPDPTVAFEKVEEWYLKADANTVRFVVGYSGLMYTYLDSQGHVILTPLNMLPPPPEAEAENIPKPDLVIPTLTIGMIPIPNPFKTFKPRETVKPFTKLQNRDGRLLVGTEKDAGMCWDWMESDEEDDAVKGMRHAVKAYAAELGREDLKRCCEIQINDVIGVHIPTNKSFVAMRQSGVETYQLRKTDQNGDSVSPLKDTLYCCNKASSNTFQPKTQTVAAIPLLGQLCIVAAGKPSPESGLQIGLQNLDRDTRRNENVWKGSKATPDLVETTAALPVNADSIFLYRTPLSELVSDPTPQVAENTLDARVTKLWIVTEEWSKELFLLEALDDGGIACWNARSLQLVGRWMVFISELESVVSLSIGDDRLGKLKGCVMAAASAGTIAIIVLDDMSLLCVIPGSPAPLDRICVGGDNLLLFYSHGLTRLWDMKTHEFWRSLQQNKGEELLNQGGWLEVPVGRWEAPRPIHTLGALQNNISSPDAAATLIMDVSSIVELVKDEATKGQLV